MERDLKTGYCCNVHGGTTLEEVKSNLEQHACEVKRLVSPDVTMPIGLWLSQSAIAGLGDESQAHVDATNSFGDWLAERGFDPFTFNGFPLGDFHQEVVKHDVYLPTWADSSRLQYTMKLAQVQSLLLARAGAAPKFQTISTLPLGWPTVPKEKLFTHEDEFLQQCAANLRKLAEYLWRLNNETGNHVMVCIEPEPGCVFDTCHDIVRFFNQYMLADESAQGIQLLEYIGVCHDVCHSAVMFEDQATAVKAYRDAGIRIGKVQVSSAIKVEFGDDEGSNRRKLQQLSQFSEPRYLHQTCVRRSNGSVEFFEDLSAALASQKHPEGEWRVHFHVPIFAEKLDLMDTTQDEISLFLGALRVNDVSNVEHYEVETYAWNVLPEDHRDIAGGLASGIAQELTWFEKLVRENSP